MEFDERNLSEQPGFSSQKDLGPQDQTIWFEELDRLKEELQEAERPTTRRVFTDLIVELVKNWKICFPEQEARLNLDEKFKSMAIQELKWELDANYQNAVSGRYEDWRFPLKMAVAVKILFPEMPPETLIDNKYWQRIMELERAYKNRILEGKERKSKRSKLRTQDEEITDFLQRSAQTGGFFNSYFELAAARKDLLPKAVMFENPAEEETLRRFGFAKLERSRNDSDVSFMSDFPLIYLGEALDLAILFPQHFKKVGIDAETWQRLKNFLQKRKQLPTLSGEKFYDTRVVARMAANMQRLADLLLKRVN